MRRTSTSLSDGRDLIYFDDDATAATTPRDDVKDTRDLEPTATSSEIRYDALLDEWVAVASHRQSRTYLPPANECPLCPSREGHPTEIPASDYDVVVFENRFPSFATDVELVPDGVRGGDRRPGLGRCEVVVFTSNHDLPVSQLSPQRVRLILDAWVDRTVELGRLPFVEQVFCFENRGQEIGVTLNHPHGQIYAYPFVTPRTRVMLDNARRHRERTGRDLFAARLDAELADGARVVTTSEHWVAFVPFSARWPVEVHVYPRHRVPDLPALDDDVRDDFPEIYLRVLKALDGLYDKPLPYISGWHQAPVRTDRELASLHLEVFSVKRAADKLKFLAGSESGMGAFVNDIAPERTAAMLREQLPR
jgi:UDPglucose--hexose-1-phosphate uridylyltransferase